MPADVLGRIAGEGGADRLGSALNLHQGVEDAAGGASAPGVEGGLTLDRVASQGGRTARPERFRAEARPGYAANRRRIALIGVRAEALEPFFFRHPKTVSKIQVGANFLCI